MIAITGASGRLGRSVTLALAARGAPQVRLGTRDPASLGGRADGFEAVFADFDRPESLVELFRDARVALIICGTAANDKRIGQHRHAIDAAREAGVGHVIYTSFVNARPRSLFPFAASHADTEAYLAASGLPHTVVRNNHYFDNLRDALLIARETGVLSLPGAAGKVAYLGLPDIGDAFAELLVREAPLRAMYELSGPEALDLFEVAARARAAWEQPVRAAEMEAGQYAALLRRRGLPPYVVEAQLGIRLACGANEYSRVTGDVSDLLGRKPQALDIYLGTLRPEPAPRRAAGGGSDNSL